ncbi:MAG: DUF1549 domain-containing protein, partial [Planctomycetales bacterium]
QLQINESVLGLGHLRMVSHGYNPVDAREEESRFIDDQIDVVSKAILGLTVSCARCHDHKFDAISQQDYYALFGVFASCRPALLTADLPGRQGGTIDELRDLKRTIRKLLAEKWLESLDDLSGQLKSLAKTTEVAEPWKKALDEAVASEGQGPGYAWTQLARLKGQAFASRWKTLKSEWVEVHQQLAAEKASLPRWDISRETSKDWFVHGPALQNETVTEGDFRVLPSGPQVISSLLPAGFYSYLLSDKLGGVLSSPRFLIDATRISVRVIGDGNANTRLVIHNYPRQLGLYPQKNLIKRPKLMWHTFGTDFWVKRNHYAHIEFTTAANQPVRPTELPEDGRSYFGVTEVVFHSKDKRPAVSDTAAPLFALIDSQMPTGSDELADLYM